MRLELSCREDRVIAGFALFALAFAVRTVFAWQWADMPYGNAPLLDAQIYDRWAWEAANGYFPAHAYYQSPLYPVLLSLVYRLAGHSLLAASFLNAACDAGAVTVIALIAARLFGGAAAMGAGLLAAFYAPIIFYAAPPMKEPLVQFLMALFVLSGITILRGGRWPSYLFNGAILGLLVLARGNALLLVPIVPGFVWAQGNKRGSGFASKKGASRNDGGKKAKAVFLAIYLFGFVAVFVPSAVHNWNAARDVVPVTYADGFNFYIGHSDTANGTNAYPPEVSTGPEQERLDTTYIAEQQAGHALEPSQVSAYWRGRAVDFALHHPGREAVLLGRKCLAFWNGGDSFDNYDVAFVKKNFPSLLNAPLVGFACVSALAAFAVFGGALKKRTDHLFAAACAVTYMLSVLIFYVTDRYRLPVVVFLLPLAGVALPLAIELARRKEWEKMAIAFAGGAVFLALALAPQLDTQNLDAFDWGVLTGIYADKGEDEKALGAFHKGRAISQQEVGSQAYVKIAQIYERQGQTAQAERMLRDVAAHFPQDGVVLYNLGRAEAARGDLQAARATLLKAQELAPAYGLIYAGLARIDIKLGDKAAADEAVKQGLARDPENTDLLFVAQ